MWDVGACALLGPFDHVSEPMRVRAQRSHRPKTRVLLTLEREADERLPEAALEVRRAMRLRDKLRTSGGRGRSSDTSRSICSTRK